MSFSEVIKQAATEAVEARKPACILYGVVASASPLTITIENRLTVGEAALIVPRELRPGYLDTHKHHTVETDDWTNDGSNTLKNREYYYGLKAGERVILLRDAGGQRFLVMGRA